MKSLPSASRRRRLSKMRFATILLATIFGVLAKEKNPFEGDKVFRIKPTTDADVSILRKWISDTSGLDVWKEPSHPRHPVDVHVPAKKVKETAAMLHKYGINYKFMISNVGAALDVEKASNTKNAFSTGFQYNKYNTYEETMTELRRLAALYPHASTFSVGRSYEGRDMLGIKVTAPNSNSPKPVVWIDGGIHAREWISPAAVMFFLNTLLTSSHPGVTEALGKYDFFILPIFNVDGYAHTFSSSGARLWRKTRSRHPWGCLGADPNRNWDHQWGGVGTSSNPCEDIYHGSGPHSEVEVANVARYLTGIRNLKAYWNVHAYGQLLLTPWSYTTAYPRDYYEIARVAAIFTNAVRQRYGTSYRYGPPSHVLYSVAGGSIDFTYGKMGVTYSYALELRDTGTYGFLLPAWFIQPTGEETADALIAAVNAFQ